MKKQKKELDFGTVYKYYLSDIDYVYAIDNKGNEYFVYAKNGELMYKPAPHRVVDPYWGGCDYYTALYFCALKDPSNFHYFHGPEGTFARLGGQCFEVKLGKNDNLVYDECESWWTDECHDHWTVEQVKEFLKKQEMEVSSRLSANC